MFIGVNANHTPEALQQLEIANALEGKNTSNDEIFKATGWFRFSKGDNQWRKETDDSQLELSSALIDSLSGVEQKDGPVRLNDAFTPTGSLNHYHEFNNVIILPLIKNNPSNQAGLVKRNYDTGTLEIYVDPDRTPDEIKATIIHEAQHVIQKIEKFAVGGNSQMFQDIDMLKEKQVESLNEMKDILSKNPRFAEKIKSATAQFVDLHKYSDKGFDWDSVPDDVADTYFMALDALSDEFPELEARYFELSSQAQMDDVPIGASRHITSTEQYLHLSGEIEAYEVADRINMSKEERSQKTPLLLPKTMATDLNYITETDSDKLIKSAWINNTESDHPITSDISIYSDNYFAKIRTNHRATADEIMKATNQSFLVMISDVTQNLPSDNQLVKDFDHLTAWLGTTPSQFRNADYKVKEKHGERFHNAFTDYLTNEPEHHPLRGVFRTAVSWIKNIFENQKALDIEISIPSSIKGVFDGIFGEGKGIDIESDFQANLLNSINESTSISLSANLAISSIIDMGYTNIANRAGIEKSELFDKYEIEFKKMAKPKPPPIVNGEIKSNRLRF